MADEKTIHLSDKKKQWGPRETLTRLSAISDQSVVGFCRMNADAVILDCNRAFSRMLGGPDADVGGACLHDLPRSPDETYDDMEIQDAIENGKPELLTRHSFLREDGSVAWVDLALTFMRERGDLTIFGAAIDVSEQVYMEGALVRSEANFRKLFDTMTNGCALHRIICDEDGTPVDYRFLSVNKAFEEQTGLKSSDVVGHTAREVLPELDSFWVETYGNVALTGEAAQFEHFSEPLGRYYLVHAYSPRHLHFAVVFNDITDQKRAAEEKQEQERQALHAQKLESLGVMAGGVAHDFNNILMAIMGNAELVLGALPTTSPIRKEVQEIQNASQQASELCRRLLDYSGKGTLRKETVNMADVTRRVCAMLGVTLPTNCGITLKLQDTSSVHADAAQMKQVVMNLVINAAEAIGDNEGTISIEAGTKPCEDADLSNAYICGELPPGDCVYLAVRDTGCGMSADVQERMFEPFFTTKFAGRGLGMAAILGIIRSHDGCIVVNSTEGGGTTIRVVLPAEKARENKAATTTTASETDSGAEQKVLLVDDDAFILSVSSRMLNRLGYSVIEATSGEEAVAKFAKAANDVTCVILDMRMPGMSGRDVYDQLRGLDSGIPIVISSGYDADDVAAQFDISESGTAYIQKPYRLDELRVVLDNVLG